MAPGLRADNGLSWLIDQLRPWWPRLLLVLCLSLVSTLIGLLQPYVTKYIIDDGLLAGDYTLLVWLCVLMFSLAVVSALLGAVNRWYYVDLSTRILLGMRSKLFTHLLNLSPRFHADMPPGQLIARLDGDIAEVQRFAVDSLLASVNGVIALAGALALMLTLSPLLTGIALVLIPAIVLFLRWTQPRLMDVTRRVRERASDVTAFLVETLGAVKFIQTAATGGDEGARLDALNERFRHDTLRMQMTNYAVSHVPALITTLSTVIVFLAGGYLVIHQSLSLGTLVAFSAYLARSTGPVHTLLGLYAGWQRARVSLQRVGEIRERQPEVVESLHAVPLPGPADAAIRFEDVWFGYGDDRPPVLRGINLEIPAGSKTLIAGASGAGKSTLIDLLQRHYDPDRGRIEIGGRDIRDFRLDELRRRVAVVTQETVLFSGSILDNIRYVRPDAGDDEVTRAARVSRIDQFADALPNGLDTELGNRAVKLSGGQRQRLAIARALLQDPVVLILDEATASIDSETEAEIIRAIDELFHDRTRIVISHRAAARPDADVSLVFDVQGQVIRHA